MLRSFGLISLLLVGLASLSEPAEAQLRAWTRRAKPAATPTREAASTPQEVVSNSAESSVPVEADCDGTTVLSGRGKFTLRAEGRLSVDTDSYLSFDREDPFMTRTDTGFALQYDNVDGEFTVSGEAIELTLEGKLKSLKGEGAGQLTLSGRGSYRLPDQQGRIPDEGVCVVFGPSEKEEPTQVSPLLQARPRLSAPPEPQQRSD